MQIKFEKITNYDEKIDIKVKNHQTYFIENIDECLNEAKYYDGWSAYKIIDGETLIAFAMYAQFSEENNRVFLDRFFIDENHQEKGYSKPILNMLIEKIKAEYSVKNIYSSVFKDNPIGTKVFADIGFKSTGDVDLNGEIIMVV